MVRETDREKSREETRDTPTLGFGGGARADEAHAPVPARRSQRRKDLHHVGDQGGGEEEAGRHH